MPRIGRLEGLCRKLKGLIARQHGADMKIIKRLREEYVDMEPPQTDEELEQASIWFEDHKDAGTALLLADILYRNVQFWRTVARGRQSATTDRENP
ncbi:hypothetical protein LCGC14_1110870 [marine sediment metagenome]|uniref:Uncharacterized protein n=1 Tax=marine sediment metagenome TaxID=412755 RepID=A0A0F9QCW2_9ZZZZ